MIITLALQISENGIWGLQLDVLVVCSTVKGSAEIAHSYIESIGGYRLAGFESVDSMNRQKTGHGHWSKRIQ